ncbi:MAG: hypothetical protein KGL53_10480, partial [Elusimicrobia bacterium]|nr:hypothetical protein [Elusimicrobiota bacterium]
MPESDPLPFDAQALDVLKAVGKTLSQINLYSVSHPAVRTLLGETSGRLSALLSEGGVGELVYIIDADKLIANGRVIGAVSQVPNSIPNTFQRFKLHSVALKAGVSDDELAAFCELASLRPDQARGLDAANFLVERGVEHISVNEAVYAKVEKAEEGALPSEVGAGAGPGAGAGSGPGEGSGEGAGE